jgi:queuosine precursor transporter
MKKSMITLWPLVVSMALVILLSNKLVQIPLQGTVLGIDLSAVLTWGALSYPAAFLVTDLTNRMFGLGPARRVVAFGFVLGVVLTIIMAIEIASGASRSSGASILQALFHDPDALSMLRTAGASGTAFLIAQLLDIKVFDVLRGQVWWKAPAVSSLLGSFIDTLLFFFLAFAGTGLPWASWAVGDFFAKLLMIGVLLYPFRLLVRYYPRELHATA